MDLRLSGKTAFISGSTSGIGFATAQALLSEGVEIWINGRHSEGVASAVSHLRELCPGSRVEGCVADFSVESDVQALTRALPAIDILINNVGIYRAQSFVDTSDDDWQRQMEVNLMSGVRLSRHWLPKMLASGWGRILFISSECASLVPADLIPYSVTKAALLALSRGLAQQTAGTGVTVNTLLPGSTMTEGAARFLQDVSEKEQKTVDQVEKEFFKQARPNSLLNRFATPEEVASSIAYFSSPLASATNGAAIKVEGGSMGGLL